MTDIYQEYIDKFDQDPPMPHGVTDDELEKVIALHIVKGEPIPPDYDWWADIPDDAVS